MEVSQEPDIISQRRNTVQLSHGLSMEVYDAKFDDILEELIALGYKNGIIFNRFLTSFNMAIDMIETAILSSQNNQGDIDNDLINLYEIEQQSELFHGYATILPSGHEESIILTAINLDPAVDWVVNHIQSSKCGICKNMTGWIRQKACDKAGPAICSALANLGGKFAKVIREWGCNAPINLSKLFTNLCTSGVQWIQRNAKATDGQICKAISLPTISWRTHNNVVFTITGRTVNFGHPC